MEETVAGKVCQFSRALAERIGASRFRTWFGDLTAFEFERECVVVIVPNDFIGRWIANNHVPDLMHAAREVFECDCRVEIRVRSAHDPAPHLNGAARNGQPVRDPRAPAALKGRLASFVVGPSNRLAFATAQEIARAPGRAVKLLVLHGGCGLGKTHLLQGLCNEVQSLHPELVWRFVSGEEFTNEFVGAVRNGRNDNFRSRFRHVDLLVVDDIHFIANKRATQDEFLHTFNAIDAAGKTIVLSSDRHPRLIASLSEPLINRLVSGVVVEILPPDFVTRRTILRNRAMLTGRGLPDDVLDYVAHHVTNNVRELEGALVKLAAVAALNNEPITLAMARAALADSITEDRRPLEVAEIERRVATRFGISREQIHSRGRDRTTSLARAVAMFLVRKLTTLSFPEIGRAMGNKNHSTVLMAAQRVEVLVQRNALVQWRSPTGSHELHIRDLLAALEDEMRPRAA